MLSTPPHGINPLGVLDLRRVEPPVISGTLADLGYAVANASARGRLAGSVESVSVSMLSLHCEGLCDSRESEASYRPIFIAGGASTKRTRLR